jgi:hypothetical protein
VSALRRRIERIAAGGGGRGRCPECGLLPDGVPDPDATYEILFEEEWEERGIETPDENNVYCEKCGELVFGVISFGDEDSYPGVIGPDDAA